MTDRAFDPNAAAVKQRDTLVIGGTYLAGESITLKINNVDVVITFGTLVTTAEIAQTIYEAFNANDFTDTTATVIPQDGAISVPQFNEIECTVSGSTLTFLSRVAGVPFGLSRTLSSASGTATLNNNVVSATGPSWFSNQDNWTGNTVPIDGVDISIEDSSQDLSDGLVTAIQPGTFELFMSYTGYIGRRQRNTTNASQPYSEGRQKSLQFNDNAGATGKYRLGLGTGPGAAGVRLDFLDGKSQVTVINSAPARDNIPNMLLQGTNADNTLTNLNGSVGVSFYTGEAMTLASLTNGQQGSGGANATTVCGSDADLTGCDVNQMSGRLTTNSAIGGTVNIQGGEMHHQRGNIATLNHYKGLLAFYDALTITSAYINAKLDCSQTSGTITFTNCEFGPLAEVNAPAGNIAFSNPFTQGEYSPQRKLNLGPNRTFDVGP